MRPLKPSTTDSASCNLRIFHIPLSFPGAPCSENALWAVVQGKDHASPIALSFPRTKPPGVAMTLRRLSAFGISDVGSQPDFDVRLGEQFLGALRVAAQLIVVRGLRPIQLLVRLDDILLRRR